MKTQATRLTEQEIAYWDHWTARGYTFAPGEKPPLSTTVAPNRVTPKRPILDALLGLSIIVGVLLSAGYWLAHAAKLL